MISEAGKNIGEEVGHDATSRTCHPWQHLDSSISFLEDRISLTFSEIISTEPASIVTTFLRMDQRNTCN